MTRPNSPRGQGGAEESSGVGVTWRAVGIALVLMPFQSWWIVQMELIRSNTWPTMLSLPLHTVFILLLLVGLNALIKRRAPKRALEPGELLTIYIMLAISGVITGYGLVQALVGWIIAPIGRATAGYDWQPLFRDALPAWLVVTDEQTLALFYEGESTLFTAKHLLGWARPALAWSAFILAFFAATLSLNALLRRRWIEEERLTFPLVQVPVAMVEPSGALFRNRLLWIGFAAAVVLGSVNGLHGLFPAVPSLQPDTNSLNQMLGRRWPCFLREGGTFWPPYLWAVGVGFLMPVDIAFSYWFFFWVVKLEELAMRRTLRSPISSRPAPCWPWASSSYGRGGVTWPRQSGRRSGPARVGAMARSPCATGGLSGCSCSLLLAWPRSSGSRAPPCGSSSCTWACIWLPVSRCRASGQN